MLRKFFIFAGVLAVFSIILGVLFQNSQSIQVNAATDKEFFHSAYLRSCQMLWK